MSKQYFLSEAEFNLCCAAAGIEAAPCFQQSEGDPSEETAEAAVWLLTQRKFLHAEEDGGFTLCRELSDSFRTIRDSETVLFLRQNQRQYNLPYCIVYGNSQFLASLQPGDREEDYVGITLYPMDDIDEWLEGVGLVLPGNMPDDLLETAAAEKVEDDAFPPEVEKFLSQNAWPAANAPEPAEEDFPQEILACVDCYSPRTLELLRRLYLVRLPLFDRMVSGLPNGIDIQMYRPSAVAAVVRQMLLGEEPPQETPGAAEAGLETLDTVKPEPVMPETAAIDLFEEGELDL